MLILKEKIRYPEKNDKFFLDKGSPDEIAWLDKTSQQFGRYAGSYQTGALTLIDTALANKDLRDYNIYPAVFLIRHYIELRLKELIQGLNYCKEQNNDFPIGHDLQNFWSDFKKAYSSIGENANGKIFETIDELIKEMTSVDPMSMSFRYPVDRQGEKTQKLEYVNLSNLRETFIRVCFFLME
jgi:hypothetical protein